LFDERNFICSAFPLKSCELEKLVLLQLVCVAAKYMTEAVTQPDKTWEMMKSAIICSQNLGKIVIVLFILEKKYRAI